MARSDQPQWPDPIAPEGQIQAMTWQPGSIAKRTHPTMQAWEYQVIHLNVESPPDGKQDRAPDRSTDAQSSAATRPVFSQPFLRREFPQFYEPTTQASPSPSPQHPAQQLQIFLNRQGSQGWELLGVYPLGVLLMMIFRRPQITAAAGEQPRGVSEPSLAQQLPRLGNLEQPGHPTPDPCPPSPQCSPPPPPRQRRQRPSSGPQPWQRLSGQVMDQIPGLLSPATMARLSTAVPLPAKAAARALGLRSAASLANLGARHGYPPGLIKIGPQGMMAIYTGTGPALGGGNPPRLWVVLPVDSLHPSFGTDAPQDPGPD